MEDVLINDMRLEELCFDTINSIDWITIFVDYPDKAIIKDFRFKEYPQGWGLATRNCEFLDDWKGNVYLKNHSLILYLTKIDNKQVDIKIPLLKFGSLRKVQLRYELSFAQVTIKLDA